MNRKLGVLAVLGIFTVAAALMLQQAKAPKQPVHPLAPVAQEVTPPVDTPPGAAVPLPSADQLTPALRKSAVLVAQMLQQYHFARQPLDEARSREWLKSYMEALDYNHLIFLSTDLEEFSNTYAASLPRLTMNRDISPAFDIFKRFRERLDLRMSWVKKRVEKPFDFSSNMEFERDRTKASWPTTLEEADALWEMRLKSDMLQEHLTEKKTEDPAKSVEHRYERFHRTAQDYDAEDIFQLYLSTLASIYDPHSQYMSPSTLEDFSINMKLSLVGIGAVLSSEDGYCVIKEIIPGGPADLSGKIKTNDKIVAVAQGEAAWVDIIDMKLRNAVQLIRGQKGTIVRLKVIPADAADASKKVEIPLVRDVIQLAAQQATAQLVQKTLADGKVQKIGVIELPSFYGDVGGDEMSQAGNSAKPHSTTQDVKVLLEYLKGEGIDGLVLDLRRNGGGLLDEAVNLTGLFIGRGPVVQVKEQNGTIKVRASDQSTPFYTGPLVVLTSRQSASASEIFAGALQNYKRAIIVGDKSTHGKGTVQAVLELGRYLNISDVNTEGDSIKIGALKLTIQKFYLPDGHSTQNRGVIPDISLPSINDYLKIGEADAPHALPWDEIKPTQFALFKPDPTDIVSKLKVQSSNRINGDKLFGLLKDEIERLRVRIDTGRISLNEKTRLAERSADDARRKSFEVLQKQLAQTDNSTVKRLIIKDSGANLTVAESSKDPKKKESMLLGRDDDEASPLPQGFSADLHLRETLNIMSDYLTLYGAPPVDTLTATTASQPAAAVAH